MIRTLSLIAALCCMALSQTSSANLIVNGSLDGTPGTGANGLTSWSNQFSPDLGNVDGFFGAGGWGGGSGAVSNDGGTWVTAFNTEAIFQTVTGFTVGEDYLLRFEHADVWGSTPASQGNPFTVTITDVIGVDAGGNDIFGPALDLAVPLPNDLGTWEFVDLVFTATSDTAEVRFTSGAAAGGVAADFPSYLSIDGISLTLVPEPSSAALLGLGVVSLASLRRRRIPVGRR